MPIPENGFWTLGVILILAFIAVIYVAFGPPKRNRQRNREQGPHKTGDFDREPGNRTR